MVKVIFVDGNIEHFVGGYDYLKDMEIFVIMRNKKIICMIPREFVKCIVDDMEQ